MNRPDPTLKGDQLATPPQGPGASRPALALALLLAINLFNYIDRYILAAVEKPIRDHFFAPDDPDAKAWTGLLATAFMVSYMVAAPLFGWLADRTRRWAIIGIGVILWSLASGGTGLAAAATFAVLLATRVLVGIGEAAYGPAAPTVIADLYPVSRRGAVLAWFYMAIPVGSALGYVLGGVIAKQWGWQAAFYAVVPPGILLGVLCFMMPEPIRGGTDGAVSRRGAGWSDYRTLLQTPSYVLNTAGMTAMTFAIGGISFWMPTYIHEFRGQADFQKVNMIFGAITVIAGLTATLTGGYLGDRLRAKWPGSYFIVSAISMLLGFPVLLLVLVTPFPWAWGLIFIAEFCVFLNTGPSNTILANVTHPAIRASAFALTIFVIHALGDAISPPLIGWISGLARSDAHPTGNMNVGFVVVAMALLVGGVLWLLGAKHLARDTELAPTRIGPRE